MVANRRKYAALDGGWGWYVVLAYALNNVITIPILQGFNLIHKDVFQILKISVTDATVITNMNAAFGMILGLGNGPLIRKFGYRKVAIAGALMYTIGIIATSFAMTKFEFIFFYGMITSYGMGLSMQSYSIALHSYFDKKRSLAVGIYMTITGLGPIVMPPLQSTLLSYYGAKGTMFILGGLSLNSLAGALLLQPMKWHAKIRNEKEGNGDSNEEIVALNSSEMNSDINIAEKHTNYNPDDCQRRISLIYDVESASLYEFETPMSTNRRLSNTYCKNPDTINLGSNITVFHDAISRTDEEMKEAYKNKHNSIQNITNQNCLQSKIEYKPDRVNMSETPTKKKSKIMKWLIRVVHFFDLNLMRDPIFIILTLGVSVALLAELNFSQLTPFILGEMSLTTNQIAMVMSCIGTGDLVLRALAHFIGKCMNMGFRTMYLFSLVLLIISRMILVFTENYSSILMIAVGLGVAKGIRSVYMPLITPDYIKQKGDMDRLASASSIQNVINGCFLLLAGPLIGFIRDVSSSFIPCVGFINAMTLFTVIMWSTEMVIKRIRERKRSKETIKENGNKECKLIPQENRSKNTFIPILGSKNKSLNSG